MVRVIKCYYCGEYFDEEEAIGWDICASCALSEEKEYEWLEDEREEWLRQGYEPSEDVHVEYVNYEEEEE